MIKVENLEKSYKGKKVVDKVSFFIDEGEVFALLGSNGAGKSTTIKMMLQLVKADGGSIKIQENEQVGYSPETPYFPPYLTGREVLSYYGALQKIPKAKLCEEIGELLEMVGLEDDKTRVRYYSKGMLQRLALAQALLGNPKILILDEPCAGLDALGRIEMLELILSLKKQGKTILMNSHILSDMEKVCDKGLIMKKGKMMREFSREEFTEENTLENMFVAAVGTK